jgi:hypothetical protein
MANLKTGSYAVAPSSEPGGYRFSLAADPYVDSLTITTQRVAYSVNFTAPNLGSVASMFTIKFHYINYIIQPANVLALGDSLPNVMPTRVVYYLFAPFMGDNQTFGYDNHTDSQFSAPYRWTSLVYTLSNNFYVLCVDHQRGTYFTIYINLPLTGCPAMSDSHIDSAAQTITQPD